MKKCKHEETRFLDCADCEEKQVPCELIVCCECGEEVKNIRGK